MSASEGAAWRRSRSAAAMTLVQQLLSTNSFCIESVGEDFPSRIAAIALSIERAPIQSLPMLFEDGTNISQTMLRTASRVLLGLGAVLGCRAAVLEDSQGTFAFFSSLLSLCLSLAPRLSLASPSPPNLTSPSHTVLPRP